MSAAAYRPFAFLAAALAWTWAFWSVPALTGLEPWSGTGRWLIYLGGVGPLLAGLWFQHRHSTGRGLRDLWQRLVQPGRAPLWLWAATLLLIPALSLLAHGLLMLGGGTGPTLALPGATWPAALGYAAFIFLLGPLPEEIGWRGYGLDALLVRHDPVVASIILGAAWGAWHLPLLAMDGYYDDFGGPPVLWLFLWSILMKTLIMTWGYLASDRSLLLMVVFHFMINATGEVLPRSAEVETVFQFLLTAVALAAALHLRSNWHAARR
jgi:membrane protease YdiL (CAAX protease family)